MKKMFSLLLSAIIAFSVCSCGININTNGTQSQPTDPDVSSEESTEPSSETEESSEPENQSASLEDMTLGQLKNIAEELSVAWDNYCNAGVPCTRDYGSYSDIEKQIDPSRLEAASGVSKCQCCNSIEEAKAHAARVFASDLYSDEVIENYLFEYEGALYCIEGAKGYISHDLSTIEITDITADRFIFTANLLSSGGEAIDVDKFAVKPIDGTYKLVNILPLGLSGAEPDSNTQDDPEPSQPESSEPESSKPESSKPESSKAQKLVKPDKIYEDGYHCVVAADGGLNMRYGPGKKYGKVMLIPNGAELLEYGSEGSWIYVKYKGKYGWVSSEFVQFYGGMAKPVIYLYPQKKTDVSVSLSITNGGLTCTYPEYKNGWNVTAYPGGKLINKADGLEYSYLYWEGESTAEYDFSEGYVVRGSDTAAFLRTTLSKMGLTPREYNEFIVYWLPLMQNNKYNLISFQNKAYTDAAKLSVSPKPDSMLRVFMAYKAIDKPVSVKQPTIEKFVRNGFTVVEWGGTEVK